jgi:lysophospholipase L1-like esterase
VRSLSRYVAVWDSFTEGLDDLRGDGSPRGWTDRIADVLAETEPDFRYANLAVRSLRIDAIVNVQVPAAVAMRPDLVTFAGGGSDILGVRADLDHIAARMDEAVAE